MKPTLIPTYSTQDEFLRLYRQQFGQPVELWFRILGVGFGSIILYLYTGWIASFVWAGLFIAMNGLQYAFATSRLGRVRRADIFIQVALSHVCLALFMWLPVYMFVYPNELIRVAGGVTLAAKLVYLVHTADRLKSMIIGQVTILTIASAAIIYANRAEYTSTVAWVGQVFVFSILISFVSICLFTARRRRMEFEIAAARSAQAQKMEAIGHVSGGIAHHFNNLLAVIIGNIELCEDTTDEDERHRLHNNAHNAALNGKRLVQLMLEFTARERATLHRVSAGELLDKIVQLQSQIVPEDVSIISQTDPPPCHLLVDKDLFLTAMIHLVSNALDAMKNEGSIQIEVRKEDHKTALTTITGQQIEPGEYVAFTVRDTGPGIAQHHLARVAEPFFTTKQVGDGAGLGLSMVSGFAERHGGGLLIATAAAGTTATILLPTHVS